MKKFDCVIASTKCVAISLMLCAFLAACGDDDSWSPSDADNTRSSSSVILSGDSHEGSCSSSVSVIPGSDPESSSAEKQGSSSSSSVILSSSEGSCSSSSSVVLATPCKTDTEDNCEYGELIDDRDGQTYKTVKIGAQWWMAENLNFETTYGSCYKDSIEYCEKYGRQYAWNAAVGKLDSECALWGRCFPTSGDVQGVCPDGWHLPSKAEFETLFMAVGEDFTAGTMLKSTSGWDEGGNGMDAFGFSALPAGAIVKGYDLSAFEGVLAFFWSSTEDASSFSLACNMRISSGGSDAILLSNEKGFRYSVRCLKDRPQGECGL
ncbi:MAG: fibrobacter succinogenes major paralogous domain-containing protein [Fibrobacter sp.]|nr:fibrobacter succinogenes major paralogous domain-containing protein [Fibrobacter sp.]MBR5692354.1 fibrobacter succinogenes major paralogous domain-containing protein [Fibrobacter sp.]